MTSSPADIDKGWAWLVLLASFTNMFVCSGLCYIAGLFQIAFLEQFKGSVALTSWITALFSSLMQLGGPLCSAVSNNFNCRTSVMLGGALMSVGLFVSSMANSLEMLFVTFGIIAGSGIGLAYTASIVIINFFFVERRNVATGVALSASGLGILILPKVMGYMLDTFSLRESLMIMAGISAQVCVMGALMSSVHESKNKRGISRRYSPCAWWGKNRNLRRPYQTDDDVDTEENAMKLRPVSSMNEGEEIMDVGHTAGDFKSNKINERPPCQNFTSDKDYSSHPEDQVTSHSPCLGDHQLIADKKYCDSNVFHIAKPTPSICVDNVAIGKISFPSLAQSRIFGSHKDFRNTSSDRPQFGSHRELTSHVNLRISTLKNISNSQSHQELSNCVANQKTASNPNLILRLNVANSGSLRDSRSSLNPSAGDSLGHVVVISRNPSIISLVPPSCPLDVIITPKKNLQNNAPTYSNNIFESKIVIGELYPLTISPNSEKGDNSDDEVEAMTAIVSNEYPPLYRNKQFWLLNLSLVLGNAGCGVFTIHLASFVENNGLTNETLTTVLAFYGLGVLFGRCLCGALANAVKGSDLLLWSSLHALGGVCLCLMPSFGHSDTAMLILTYALGNFYGSVYAVLAPISIEMVGLNNLTTAFGLEMVWAGLGFFVSPPLAGAVVDLTNNYDYSMYCAGLFEIITGISVFLIPLLPHRKNHVAPDDISLESQSQGRRTVGLQGCCLANCEHWDTDGFES